MRVLGELDAAKCSEQELLHELIAIIGEISAVTESIAGCLTMLAQRQIGTVIEPHEDSTD